MAHVAAIQVQLSSELDWSDGWTLSAIHCIFVPRAPELQRQCTAVQHTRASSHLIVVCAIYIFYECERLASGRPGPRCEMVHCGKANGNENFVWVLILRFSVCLGSAEYLMSTT